MEGGVTHDLNTPDFMRRLSWFPTNAYAFQICTSWYNGERDIDNLVSVIKETMGNKRSEFLKCCHVLKIL
jgi:hypothetical protein